MLITNVISLYTTRIILIALDLNDIGIYNRIRGLILMFGFLNTSIL